MDKKKVTRRAAIGLGVGVAAAPLIIRALRARYNVAMPSGTGTVQVTMKYDGRDITLDVPLKRPSTPQEEKELETQLMEQLKKHPTYIEVEKQEGEKNRERRRKSVIAGYDNLEKQQLQDLVKLPLSEREKQAAAKQIKDDIQASKARSLDYVDKVAKE